MVDTGTHKAVRRTNGISAERQRSTNHNTNGNIGSGMPAYVQDG